MSDGVREEALRLAAWHEERARECEREARLEMTYEGAHGSHHRQSKGAWQKLEEIREYHDATAKTLRTLVGRLTALTICREAPFAVDAQPETPGILDSAFTEY